MNLIAKYSGVPGYARELTKNFWIKYGDNKGSKNAFDLSVSVHWRFDKEWRESINNKKMRNKPEFKEMLKNLENYTGLLTESISRYIEKICEYNKKSVNLKVYIATPTDEIEYIKKACEIMKNIIQTEATFKNIKTVDVLSSYELKKWKTESLTDKSCEWIDDVWSEVSSKILCVVSGIWFNMKF